MALLADILFVCAHHHTTRTSHGAGVNASPAKGSSSDRAKGPSKQGPLDPKYTSNFDDRVREFMNSVLLKIDGAVGDAMTLLQGPYPFPAAAKAVVMCNEAANRALIDLELIAAVEALRQRVDPAAVEKLGIFFELRVRGVSSTDGDLDYVFGVNDGGSFGEPATTVYFEAKKKRTIEELPKTTSNRTLIHQVKCGIDALRGGDERPICRWGAVYDGERLILCYTTQLEGTIHCDLIVDRAAILSAIIFLLYISVAPVDEQCAVIDPLQGLPAALSDGGDNFPQDVGGVGDTGGSAGASGDDVGGDGNKGVGAGASGDDPTDGIFDGGGRANALCAPASPMVLRESLLAKMAAAIDPMDRVRAALKTVNK